MTRRGHSAMFIESSRALFRFKRGTLGMKRLLVIYIVLSIGACGNELKPDTDMSEQTAGSQSAVDRPHSESVDPPTLCEASGQEHCFCEESVAQLIRWTSIYSPELSAVRHLCGEAELVCRDANRQLLPTICSLCGTCEEYCRESALEFLRLISRYSREHPEIGRLCREAEFVCPGICS